MSYVDKLSIIKGIAPGAILQMHGCDTVTIEFQVQSKVYSVSLQDVKHTLNAPNNLISIGWLTNNRHTMTFTATSIKFKSSSGVTFREGQKVGYMLLRLVRLVGTEGALRWVSEVHEWYITQ